MKTPKECVTCNNLSCLNVAYGVNVYPCTICSIINLDSSINKWEPIETKKMKSTSKRIIEVLKEMFTFSDSVRLFGARFSSVSIFIFANYDIIKSSDSRFALIFNAVFIGLWLLGYFSRKPDPARKGFKKWLKICKLKLKIGILKKNLKPFTDLRKYKHKSEKHIREMVLEWRVELKELKRELKEL